MKLKQINALKLVFETILKAKEILSFVAVIVAWVLALWVTNRLAPFVEADKALTVRADNNADKIAELRKDVENMKEKIIEIKSDTSYIRGAIDAHMKE